MISLIQRSHLLAFGAIKCVQPFQLVHCTLFNVHVCSRSYDTIDKLLDLRMVVPCRHPKTLVRLLTQQYSTHMAEIGVHRTHNLSAYSTQSISMSLPNSLAPPIKV